MYYTTWRKYMIHVPSDTVNRKAAGENPAVGYLDFIHQVIKQIVSPSAGIGYEYGQSLKKVS